MLIPGANGAVVEYPLVVGLIAPVISAEKVTSHSVPLFALTMVAALTLHPLFSDQAVLPREVPIPVYGRSVPGQTVKVSLGGQQITTRADGTGAWLALMPAMAAGGPHTLSVSMSGRQLIRRDIYIGEVWLVAGEGNMEMALAETSDARVALSQASLPKLRLYTVPNPFAATPDAAAGRWEKCTAAKAASFSGLGFHFARMLQETLECPVGIIQATSPASTGVAWLPDTARRAIPELKGLAVAATVPRESAPGAVFDGMIAPLTQFPIRGVIAWQGEGDVDRAQNYGLLFAGQIKSWRAAWRRDDLPFLFVQLAGYLAPRVDPGDDVWAELREAQARALRLPATAMVVAADVSEHESKTPRNKRAIAERLVLSALAVAYKRSMPHSGPIFAGHVVKDGAVHLKFAHAESGLRGRQPGPLLGFAVAGADRAFRWGDARIEKETVVVSHPAIAAPVAVRYAWERHPTLSLENGAGLPAAPFRTDNWPGIAAG